MAYTMFDENTMYIADDGNYGGGAIIITSFSEFTEEQIDILDTLVDNDKFDYAYAVLNGKDTSEWDNDYL